MNLMKIFYEFFFTIGLLYMSSMYSLHINFLLDMGLDF